MAARGVMAVWNDLEPGHEAEFDAWYTRQHIPERLSVRGFREARRYQAAEGSPRYCAFYWLETPDVLASEPYRTRLAQPSAWTRRMMPRFRGMARTPARIVCDRGCGMGGAMRFVAAMSGGEPAPAPRSLPDAIAAIQPGEHCVRVQLWVCDAGLAQIANPEARLRTRVDAVADWIVCIELDAQPRHDEEEAFVRHIAAAAAGRPLVVSPRYLLSWRLAADEAPPPAPDPSGALPI